MSEARRIGRELDKPCPERAFIAVYPRLKAVRDDAKALLDCMTGQRHGKRSPANANRIRSDAERKEDCVRNLNDSLNHKEICGLDWPAFQCLRNAQEQLRSSQSGRAILDGVKRELLEGILDLESYILVLGQQTLGTWGVALFLRLMEIRKGNDELLRSIACDPISQHPEHLPRLDLAGRSDYTSWQRRILKALDGKALKKDRLAHRVYGSAGNARQLYRAGHLKDLRDRGEVKSKRGLGYYRPDRPPPELLPVR